MTRERERDVPDRNAPIHEEPSHRLDWRTRVAIRMVGWLLGALGATWRLRVHGRAALLARDANAPRVVFTLWHGQMLPIIYAHRQPTAVMISEHRDGEILAQILGRLGFSAIRGSSSRGGARALLAAVKMFKTGVDVAITPDGPRGPRHSYAPGALVLASRAGAAIVPIVAHSDRKWRLRSWDVFEIPKPFARVTIAYGTPLRVDGSDARSAAERADEFAQRLHVELERVAHLAAGKTPSAR